MNRVSSNVGVDGDRATPTSLPSRFFFESRGTAVTMDCSPLSVFNRLFASMMPPNPGDTTLRELRQRNKGVLDAVRREFTDLRAGLGTVAEFGLRGYLASVNAPRRIDGLFT